MLLLPVVVVVAAQSGAGVRPWLCCVGEQLPAGDGWQDCTEHQERVLLPAPGLAWTAASLMQPLPLLRCWYV